MYLTRMSRKLRQSTPAIVLGCHKLGLGVIRALGQMKIPIVAVYYNKMDMGYVSKFVIADYRFCDPDQDEAGFVSSLVDLASKWEGGVVIPSDDATLIPASRHKKLLERHFKVAACQWRTTETCIRKKHTYALAQRIGVPCPRTLIPKTSGEAIDFAEMVGLPCVLKPSVGHRFFDIFRKKMVFIEDIEQLKNAYRRAEEAGTEMMVQEFIPGDDASGANYNSYFIDGAPEVEITAQKVRLSPPQLGFPRVVVSRHIPELLAPGRTMLQALGYSGFSCTEFKKDARDGIYKLMEINPRQNLSTMLSVKCGINFPYLTYMHTLNGELPERSFSSAEGIYWIDIGKDIIESIRSAGIERYSLATYLRPYLRPHVFTVPSAGDMSPFFKRSCDIVKAAPKYVVMDLLRLNRIFGRNGK